jgi:nucleoside-diphosphate-sugar epimerase
VKIFIAGGAGYVGCVLAEYTRKVDEVTVFDRFLYGVPEILDVPMISGDIRNVHPDTLEGQDVVINLAGFSNDPTAEFSPAANDALNTDAAVNLMWAAADAGVRRYVFASSASVYDKCADQEYAREDSDLIHADDMFPYSRAKINAEGQLAAVAMETGMSLVILRKGTVHGWSPRMRYDLVVNAMVGSAVCNRRVNVHVSPKGPMYRPIVDVRDVATAYQRACVLKLADGQSEIFNIVTDNLSILEIAATVLHGSNPIPEDTPQLILQEIPADRNIRSYRMSGDRARTVLGWTPKYPLSKGVQDLYSEVYLDPRGFFNPRTSNIKWMENILAVEKAYEMEGSILTGIRP